MVDERLLAERLISSDTSRPAEVAAAAGFLKGWLEFPESDVQELPQRGLPVLIAVGRDGAADAATSPTTGIPAVELRPRGGAQPGPDEWVSPTSLARHRRAPGDLVRALPRRLPGCERATGGRRALGGGRA